MKFKAHSTVEQKKTLQQGSERENLSLFALKAISVSFLCVCVYLRFVAGEVIEICRCIHNVSIYVRVRILSFIQENGEVTSIITSSEKKKKKKDIKKQHANSSKGWTSAEIPITRRNEMKMYFSASSCSLWLNSVGMLMMWCSKEQFASCQYIFIL